MSNSFRRMHLARIWPLLFAFAALATAADQPTVRAALVITRERKPAPDFALKDASGRTVTLKDFRGEIVVLDFWATYCHGCREEIPWFGQLQRTYGVKRLAVVGISLDQGGWNVLKPFLAETHVPYRMLLGDEATAQRYGIQNLPDTFVIDRQGRVAAAYVAGLVDKDNLERNLRMLLSEH